MIHTRAAALVARRAGWLAACAVAVGAVAACDNATLDREALLDPASCISCHPDHYAQWSGSMHAYASDDPVFLALNRLGQRATMGALGSLCIGCHAPTALANGATTDGTNLGDVPRYLRGVSCVACHTIDDVTALHNGGLHHADDGVMRGGIGAPVGTPAHGSIRSPLFDTASVESSKPCGACHDVVVGTAAVESTYAEWAGSVFGPDGKVPVSCPGCHMFGSDGPATSLPGAPLRRLHDHSFPGIDQTLTPWPGKDAQAAAIARDLASALLPKLCVVPSATGVEVQVSLDNIQAGHAFPSGVTHARRVWVEVVATAAGVPTYASGVFAPGAPVSRADDPDLWLLSSVLRDAAGGEVTHAWEVATVESSLLPPAVTTDPSDPRFYHARSHSYQVPGVPDRVELAIHVEPVGLELLDELIGTGDLDPAVRDAMPRRTIPTLARTWQHADGFGCAP